MFRTNAIPASKRATQTSWQRTVQAQGYELGATRHRSSATGAPPGLIPAACAAATYFRVVLRSTPRLCAISLLFRPACQWTRISMMSTTSKVLLAIGSPAPCPGWEECSSCPDSQDQPDTLALPTGNYVIGLGIT
jgi:hypothetical protein